MIKNDTNILKELIRKYGYCELELETIHLRDTIMLNPKLQEEQ